MTRLSADLVAQALTASARVHGFDPLDVLDLRKTPVRCRLGAAVAVSRLGAASNGQCASVCLVNAPIQLAPSRWGKYLLTPENVERIIALLPAPRSAPRPVAAPPAAPRVIAPEEAAARLVARPVPKTSAPTGAGVVYAQIRPAHWSPRPPANPKLLRTRLLEALAQGERAAMTLATILDVKELLVAQTLSQLRHEKLVRSDPRNGAGRNLLWSLVQPESEAAQ